MTCHSSCSDHLSLSLCLLYSGVLMDPVNFEWCPYLIFPLSVYIHWGLFNWLIYKIIGCTSGDWNSILLCKLSNNFMVNMYAFLKNQQNKNWVNAFDFWDGLTDFLLINFSSRYNIVNGLSWIWDDIVKDKLHTYATAQNSRKLSVFP